MPLPLSKFLVLCSFLIICSTAFNSSYYFIEEMPIRYIYTKPDVYTSINILPQFQPIYHLNLTHINPEKNPEHICSVYQRKLDLQVEKSFPLQKTLENVEYSSLILHHRRILLLLSEDGQLFHYAINGDDDIELRGTYDHSQLLSGSNKKLVYMKETQVVFAITNEKAIGFKNFEDFNIFSTFSSYKSVKNIYKAISYAHLLLVAAGTDGVIFYEYNNDDLVISKELITNPGVFTITDIRDISYFEKTLLLLDKNAGILFFDLMTVHYEGNNIPVMNGEKFIHQYLNVFYISGIDGNRYFMYEVLYDKEAKDALVNRQSFESLPVKHADIIGDYVFELSGETIKIFYHSLLSQWAPKKYNVVNFIAENGMKNFFPLEPTNYLNFLGFTHDKIILLKIKETLPQMFCGGYGDHYLPTYEYEVDVLSKNCPAKSMTDNVPFYSICHGKQRVQLKLLEPRLKKFLSFENFTLIMMVFLGFCLIVSLSIGLFLYLRNKHQMSNLQNEMESLRKKFKYQEIVEEKDITGPVSQEIEMKEISPDVKD